MTNTLSTQPGIPQIAHGARRELPGFITADEQLMIIGGTRVAAADGRTLPNTDPTTEHALARLPRGGAVDVEAAVQAAKSAFADASWSRITPDARGRILNQIADVIEQNADELASIDSANMGAPAR